MRVIVILDGGYIFQSFFMLKVFLKINAIILGNLLAFFILGLILDAFFDTGNTIKFICIGLSLPALGVIMYFKVGKILQELNTISHSNDDRESNK